MRPLQIIMINMNVWVFELPELGKCHTLILKLRNDMGMNN